jgi:hypothetical protein
MEIQEFINHSDDPIKQLKKMGVKIKTFKDLLILSVPYNFTFEAELLMRVRGIVINKKNNQIVCLPPRKSVLVNDIKDLEIDESDEIEYEELIDGTMINLFYHNEWLISTRTEIGGYNKWSDKKSFRKMFDEACDFDMNELSKDYSYSFVLRHKDNRNVSPIKENKLYLVEMYHITNNLKRVERNDFPEILNQVEYVTNEEEMLQLNNKSQYIKGYTIKRSDNDIRYKIQNDSYEKIKNIKTDMNNDFLIYLELRKKGNIKEYLKYFPEKTNDFREYRNKVHLLSNDLYTSYKNVFIYKKEDKEKISYHIKPLMYDIHKKYLRTKKPIQWDDIKDYIYKLDSKKLYFAINKSDY